MFWKIYWLSKVNFPPSSRHLVPTEETPFGAMPSRLDHNARAGEISTLCTTDDKTFPSARMDEGRSIAESLLRIAPPSPWSLVAGPGGHTSSKIHGEKVGSTRISFLLALNAKINLNWLFARFWPAKIEVLLLQGNVEGWSGAGGNQEQNGIVIGLE